MPSWICCSLKNVRANREDAYKIAETDNAEQLTGPAPTATKYTWEKQNDIDVSKFKVVNAENSIEVRSEIGGQQFLIENCKSSVILLLDHTATVTVDDCSNCLIVIGPCAGSVFIRDSNDCYLWAVCQQFRTRDCNTLALSLHCATQPIIENSRPITFHPIFLNYPLIGEHLLNARLSPFLNNANSVHDFTPDKYVPNYKHSTKQMIPKAPLSLLLDSQKELSLEPHTSFFIISATQNNDSESPNEVSIVYGMQKENESLETFFKRCLALATLIRRQGILCTGTRDVLATRGDLENLVDLCPDFNAGHLVSVYLETEMCRVESICEEMGRGEWRLVPQSIQEAFRRNVDRLNLTSLSL